MISKNVEFVRDSLSTGSKRNLNRYCGQLSADCDDDLFDDKMLGLMKEYAKDSNQVEVVRQWCNTTGYSQSRKEYAQLVSQLERFTDCDYTSFRWNRNYQEAKADLMKYFRTASLYELCYSCDNDIINALPKKTTHSGWTYVETGKKSKGENLEQISERFKHARAIAIENGTFNRPILCGVRTQCGNVYDEEGNALFDDLGKPIIAKHKTRLVSMVDLLLIIAELKWAKPVQDFMSKHVLWYAGGKNENVLWRGILSDGQNQERWISLDYSKYDQSISSWLIYDAFDILKSAFKEIVDSDLWDVMVNDFVHKCFIDGEGKVWESHKGVPSGSMWTQIVDSVVNMLMLTTFAYSKGQRMGQFKCKIMGDDNLVYITGVQKEEICTYLTKNFGIQVNSDKTSDGIVKKSSPEFLSRIWTIDGPYRHPNILMCKLMFPERFRTYQDYTPEMVFYSYILGYGPGMREAFDVSRFIRENPMSGKDLLGRAREQLPGWLGYAYAYGLLK